jgi:hypothetical protein
MQVITYHSPKCDHCPDQFVTTVLGRFDVSSQTYHYSTVSNCICHCPQTYTFRLSSLEIIFHILNQNKNFNTVIQNDLDKGGPSVAMKLTTLHENCRRGS